MGVLEGEMVHSKDDVIVKSKARETSAAIQETSWYNCFVYLQFSSNGPAIDLGSLKT